MEYIAQGHAFNKHLEGKDSDPTMSGKNAFRFTIEGHDLGIETADDLKHYLDTLLDDPATKGYVLDDGTIVLHNEMDKTTVKINPFDGEMDLGTAQRYPGEAHSYESDKKVIKREAKDDGRNFKEIDNRKNPSAARQAVQDLVDDIKANPPRTTAQRNDPTTKARPTKYEAGRGKGGNRKPDVFDALDDAQRPGRLVTPSTPNNNKSTGLSKAYQDALTERPARLKEHIRKLEIDAVVKTPEGQKFKHAVQNGTPEVIGDNKGNFLIETTKEDISIEPKGGGRFTIKMTPKNGMIATVLEVTADQLKRLAGNLLDPKGVLASSAVGTVIGILAFADGASAEDSLKIGMAATEGGPVVLAVQDGNLDLALKLAREIAIEAMGCAVGMGIVAGKGAIVGGSVGNLPGLALGTVGGAILGCFLGVEGASQLAKIMDNVLEHLFGEEGQESKIFSSADIAKIIDFLPDKVETGMPTEIKALIPFKNRILQMDPDSEGFQFALEQFVEQLHTKVENDTTNEITSYAEENQPNTPQNSHESTVVAQANTVTEAPKIQELVGAGAPGMG